MRLIIIILWLEYLAFAVGVPGVLPVYIEENHVGTFGWLAQYAELDEPHLLVLIDAHSDATAVSHSDALREGLRRVDSAQTRIDRIDQWRRRGRVQAFNWIEPLMPRPIERVLWLPRWELKKSEADSMRANAAASVDGRLEFEHRNCGELGRHWEVLAASRFSYWSPVDLPVFASIDLDFFAGTQPEVARARFQALWHRLLEFPKLKAVTFAVSRAWLTDDAEAFRLLHMVFDELRLVRGAKIYFDPFPALGPDDSLRALDFPDGEAPVFDLKKATADLRTFFTLHGNDIEIVRQRERWEALRHEWRDTIKSLVIRPDTGFCSTDGVYRLSAPELPALRVHGDSMTGHAKWFALMPAAKCYNLLPGIDLGKAFVPGSGPWVRDRRVFLAETFDGALSAASWKAALDPVTSLGRAIIEADVEIDDGVWQLSQATEVRVTEGELFHSALAEQFGQPYVFGAGFFAAGSLEGPETGIGNDCANFLVAAWRRTGRALPWSNPAQLRKALRIIAENAEGKAVRLDAEEIESGVAIDFGTHMAALWEDREPVGVLNVDDLVVHHLGGFPERTTLRKLAKTRPHYSIRTLPREEVCRVVIAGDVVLGPELNEASLAHLGEHLRDADIAVVNLEGIPARTIAPDVPPRYQFAFPPERLSSLRAAKIHAVGLANNHAGDAGREQIRSAMDSLHEAGLQTFGIGLNSKSAVTPWRVEANGVRLAFFGVACVEALAAEANAPGVASLPAHAVELDRALREATDEGFTTIVLPHWGREYSSATDEDQRRWARWLTEHGADAVAGSHPHVTQPVDTWCGRPIAYSLGNAVFPESLRGSDCGECLELGFDIHGRVVRVTHTPIDGESR